MEGGAGVVFSGVPIGVSWGCRAAEPGGPSTRGEERPLSIAIVSLLILAIIAIVLIPILARVLGEATRRNPNRPEGEGSDEPEPGDRGPGREE